LQTELQAGDEFSKPLETVPEETELNDATPIETYAEHLERIIYEAIDYDEILEDHDMAVTAPAELRRDHDVNINDLVPTMDTLVDLVPYNQETQFTDGWVIWFLQVLLHFVLWLPPGAAAQPLGDFISTETCPYVDVIPEEKSYFWDYVWDTVVILALLIFVAGTYFMGWMHGWWIGHNHVLRLRHIRSDRLEARLDEKTIENLALKDEVEQLVRQVQLPGGPIVADREVKHLQQQLRCLEDSFWQKDQLCAYMHRTKMGYIRQIGRLSALFHEAKDVVGRARAEAHTHAHNRCTVGRPIYHAPRGRVWHLEVQSNQLYRSQVIEQYAGDNCASFYVTPYIHDISQRTLALDMDAFMGNDISDEDPEVLAEASAILDEEARLRAAGSLSSADV
jgi:hypothetical protein